MWNHFWCTGVYQAQLWVLLISWYNFCFALLLVFFLNSPSNGSFFKKKKKLTYKVVNLLTSKLLECIPAINSFVFMLLKQVFMLLKHTFFPSRSNGLRQPHLRTTKIYWQKTFQLNGKYLPWTHRQPAMFCQFYLFPFWLWHSFLLVVSWMIFLRHTWKPSPSLSLCL